MFDACGMLPSFASLHQLPFSHSLSRSLAIVMVMLAAMFTFTPAFAQDAADEFGGAAEDVVEVVEEPAAPAADNADADADADAGAGGGSKADQNLLSWTISSLGWGYLLVFLALSVTLVSLFVMNMLAARRDTLCPQELVDAFEERLNEKDFQGAYDMARTDESVLGQVLSAGLAKLSRGYGKAIEGMQEVGEEESMKLEHRLSYMALIGNLSPMIGLFGTVAGMILAFDTMGLSGGANPSELAGNISLALMTTAGGLVVAIPSIFCFYVFKNKFNKLVGEAQETATEGLDLAVATVNADQQLAKVPEGISEG